MDSTAVLLLLRALARSRTNAHRLTLRPASAAVQRVFALCGVEERLPFVEQAGQRRG
jgi:anti-anti-sigma regulatory factor